MTSKRISRKHLVLILVSCCVLLALSAALVLTFTANSAYAAVNNLTLKGEVSASGTGTSVDSQGEPVLTQAGNTVTLTYKITDNSGIAGLQVKLKYDDTLKSAFTYQSISGKSDTSLGAPTGSGTNLGSSEVPSIMWAANVTGVYSGTPTEAFITATFTLKEGAPAGDYTFGLSFTKAVSWGSGTVPNVPVTIASDSKVTVHVRSVPTITLPSKTISVEFYNSEIAIADTTVTSLANNAADESDRVVRLESALLNYIRYTYSAYGQTGAGTVSVAWTKGGAPCGTPKEAGEYKGVFSATAGDKFLAVAGSEATTVTLTIKPYVLGYADANFSVDPKDYDGTPKSWAMSEVKTTEIYNTLSPKPVTAVSLSNTAITTGSTTLTYTLRAGANYTFDTTGALASAGNTKGFSITASINKVTNQWTTALAMGNKTYNGNPVTLDTTPVAQFSATGEPTIKYLTQNADSSWPTEESAWSATAPTNAGTYKVKATVAETAGYTGLTAEVQFTIDRAVLTDGTNNVTASWIATNVAVNAKTYNGGTKITWAEADLTTAAATEFAKISDKVDLSFAEVSGQTYDNAATYSLKAVLTLKTAAAVNYKFDGTTDNSINGTITVTVSPYEIKVVFAQSEAYRDAGYTSADLAKDDTSKYTITKADGSAADAFVATQHSSKALKFTLTLASTAITPGAHAVTVAIDSNTNYTLASGSAGTLTIGKQSIAVPTVTYEYTGNNITPAPAAGSPYTFTQDGTSPVQAQKNVGSSYTLKAVLTDTSATEWASGDSDNDGVVEITWSITALVVSVQLPSVTMEYTDTKNAAAIEAAINDAGVAPTYTFESSTAALSDLDSTYTWEYDFGTVNGTTVPGTYDITAKRIGDTSVNNFTVTFTKGTLTITTKKIDASKLSSDSNVAVEYTGSNIVFDATTMGLASSQDNLNGADITTIVEYQNVGTILHASGTKNGATFTAYDGNPGYKVKYVIKSDMQSKYEWLGGSAPTTEIRVDVYKASNGWVTAQSAVQITLPQNTGKVEFDQSDIQYDVEPVAKFGTVKKVISMASNGNPALAANDKLLPGKTYFVAYYVSDSSDDYTDLPMNGTMFGQFTVADAKIARPSAYFGATLVTNFAGYTTGGTIVSQNTIYSGADQKLTIATGHYTVTVQFNSETAVAYSAATCKNAGTYEFNITPEEGYKWSDSEDRTVLACKLVIAKVDVILSFTDDIIARYTDSGFVIESDVASLVKIEKVVNGVRSDGLVNGETFDTYGGLNTAVGGFGATGIGFFADLNGDFGDSPVIGGHTTFEWYGAQKVLSTNYNVPDANLKEGTLKFLGVELEVTGFVGYNATYDGNAHNAIATVGSVTKVAKDNTLVSVFYRTDKDGSSWTALGALKKTDNSTVSVNNWKVTNNCDGGTFWLKFTADNHEDYYAQITVTVGKIAGTITVTAKDYDSSEAVDFVNFSYVVTAGDDVTGNVWEELKPTGKDPFEITCKDDPLKNNSVLVPAPKSGQDGLLSNYTIQYVNGKYTILQNTNEWTTPAAAGGTLVGADNGIWVRNPRAFDGNALARDTDFIASAKYGNNTLTIKLYSDAAHNNELPAMPKDAGTYYIVATVDATLDYTGLTQEGTITISPATNSWTTADKSGGTLTDGIWVKTGLVYWGNDLIVNENNGDVLVSSLWGNDTLTVKFYTDSACTVEAANTTNAGTYYAKATVAATTNWTALTSVVQVVVAPYEITIKLSSTKTEVFYDGTSKDFNLNVRSITIDLANFDVAPSITENDITVTITSCKDSSGNVDNVHKKADTYSLNLKFGLSNATDNINFKVAVDGKTPEDDGSYSGYTLKIKKAPLTLVADDKTSVWGEALQPFTVSVGSGTIIYTNDIDLSTLTCTATGLTASSNVGVYTDKIVVDALTGDVANNYQITYKPGTYTITKATNTVTITAPTSITYLEQIVASGAGQNLDATATLGQALLVFQFKKQSEADSAFDTYNNRVNSYGYLDAGNWVVRASVPANVVDGVTNYDEAHADKNFTVNKADLAAPSNLQYDGGKVSWDAVTTASGKTVDYLGTGTAKVVYKVGTNTIADGQLYFMANASGVFYINAKVMLDSTTEDPNITASTALTARAYTVTFANITAVVNEANMPDPQYIFAGQSAVKPATDPTSDSHTFAEWQLDGTTTKYTFGAVNSDLTIIATWNTVTFTVTWKDGSTTLDSTTVSYGATLPAYPGATPTKGEDTEYTYTFAGWTPEVTTVKENVVLTAIYAKTPKSHTITYKVSYNGGTATALENLESKYTTFMYGAEVTLYPSSASVKLFRQTAWHDEHGNPAPATMGTQDLTLYCEYVLDIGAGDVNGDGSVNSSDLSLYCKYLVGGYDDYVLVPKGTDLWKFANDPAGDNGLKYNASATYFFEDFAQIYGGTEADIEDLAVMRMAIVGGYGFDVFKGVASDGSGVSGQRIGSGDFTITLYYFNNNEWANVIAKATGKVEKDIDMVAVSGKAGWYSATVPGSTTSVEFYEKGGSGSTGTLAVNQATPYYNGSAWSNTDSITLYYYNENGWSNVYAHASVSSTLYNNAKPGAMMSAVAGQEGWYSITVSNGFTKVEFSNGSTGTTGELTINAAKPCYNGHSWVEHFENRAYVMISGTRYNLKVNPDNTQEYMLSVVISGNSNLEFHKDGSVINNYEAGSSGTGLTAGTYTLYVKFYNDDIEGDIKVVKA